MDDPIPQQIRKGICLVLWRHGGGKLGKTVQLTLGELMWHLNAIGIRASTLAVKSALTANIKSSWIQRTRIIDPNNEEHEYKLGDAMRQRAQELAIELGTDLLPRVPRAAHDALTSDVPAITIDRKETEVMPAETPEPAGTRQFIEQQMRVLALAEDALNATARIEQLEAELQAAALPQDALAALKSSVIVLEWIGSLAKTPLGMMLDERFCGDHDTPVTASSRVLANAIARHCPGMADQK